MKRYYCIGLAILSLSLGSARAYEQSTHKDLSEAAAKQSVLVGSQNLAKLGIPRAIDDDAQQFKNSKGVAKNILELIRDGADFEDEGLRSMNHFFDPRTGGALHLDPASYPQDDATRAAIATLNAVVVPSPDYALGISPGLPTNTFTYQSAHVYFMQALIANSSVTRKASFGLLFESMGHIVHHIQDMAQPQHVRNDPHLADASWDTNCNPPAHFIYQTLCPAYHHLHNPSSFESWTARFTKEQLPLAGYPAVYGPSSGELDTFTDPRRLWTYSGKGMADFTNRNFLSADTMNLSPPLVGQAYEMSVRDLCNGAVLSCGDIDLDQTILFYPSTVDDQFRSSQGPNPFAASASIFTPDLQALNPLFRTVYTVNRATFAYDHLYLLPRAVGYSAGLINYFFRGNLEISLPDDGVYGIVDQSPSGCGNPCGFRTLKLKLKNVTPGNGQFHEEQMGDANSSGNLWAVAKYHLNGCYKPDLSGEDGGSHFNGNSCRSADEYVSVSAPHPVNIVSPDQPQQLTFDFGANPIPINASDVFLQVVFGGRLGLETDAVAVATKDISEPTFYGLENVSDYVFDDIGDQQYHPLPYHLNTHTVKVTNIRIAIGANAATNLTIANLDSLDGGQHAHLALLMDRGPQSDSISWEGEYARAPEVVPFDPAEFTQDDTGPAAGIYQRNCDVALHRGLYVERGTFFVQQAHGIISWQIKSQAVDPAPTSPEALDAHGIRPKVARDPRCSHSYTGMYDMTTMTPFVPSTAKAWSINF